ncbi:hypothetical protein TWF696_001245 [Orbilia brochopaga]|uniref:Uncharacterized protein n=1 Tax=Orbilia brochopaga TaxID=3140254 RepID=A0AAV9UCL7_9PEZI
MHSQNLLIAALAVTAVAIPIANSPSKADNARRGLVDGLLGGVLGGGTPTTPGGPLGGSTPNIDTGNTLNGASSGLGVVGGGGLAGDDGALGNLLTDLGGGGDEGLVGGLLGGLLGGPKNKLGLDPSSQKVKSGVSEPAMPQAGFKFTNVEVFSPPAGLVQKVLQALLGGKQSMFLTHVPSGSMVKSISGGLFHANPTNIKGLCFETDITSTNTWVQTACTITVSGYVKGKLVGTLEPQTSDGAKMIAKARQGLPLKFETESAAAKKTAGTKDAGMTDLLDMEVDEVKIMAEPLDPNATIVTAVLDLALTLTI